MSEFKFTPPPEAPVFRPGKDEFDDPISFISKIRPEAEKFGICRIIPPEDWRPPFSLDLSNFIFNPRIQPLKELDARSRIKLMFLRNLSEFWKMRGVTLKLPIVENSILDLFQVHELVKNIPSDGFRWRKIAKEMNFSDIRNSASIIKSHYCRLIVPWQAMKDRYRYKSFKKNFSNATSLRQRKCKLFSRELMNYWRALGRNVHWPLIGTKAVDLYELNVTVAEMERENMEIDWDSVALKLGVNEEVNANIELGKCYSTFIKPFVDNCKVDFELKSNDCSLCIKPSDEGEIFAVCAGCKLGFHGNCIRPNLRKEPHPAWHCDSCVCEKMCATWEPYGFDQAPKDYTLKEFGDMAVEFKKQHFGMPSLCVPTSVVEKEYWRLLNSFEHDITVEYGADIQDEQSRTGFPLLAADGKENRKLGSDESKYVHSKWNLNNIPVTETSVYSHIGSNIPGVTIPWMYIGMCFSTFCWHVEDHWSYSINYLHWGEPKTWYSVPRSAAEDFETAVKTIAPELFTGQPDLLHDLSTTLNPNILQGHGVPVFRTDQRAGEFVVTFPRAYHAGFNQGFNFAEAVNFAPPDWIPIGRQCIDHYASLKHLCVFSHDELMCKLAEKCPNVDKSLAKAALSDLVSCLKFETATRGLIFDSGVSHSRRAIFETVPDDNRLCQSCKTTCFLSAIVCDQKQTMFCIAHFTKMTCNCDKSQHILLYRYDLNELLQLLQKLVVYVNDDTKSL